MCFHISRFEARLSKDGEIILYEEQDVNLWSPDFISKGGYFLSRAANGNTVSKYHLEAGIAYWNTRKEDSSEKWQGILQLYNQLLQVEYSPVAALNRTYALARARGKQVALKEAEKLNLTDNPFYFSLLGELYTDIDNFKALTHWQNALALTKTTTGKTAIKKKIAALSL
jgi:RNA polymerase sigma-70 factor (ECF subfamily)